jgi:thiamine-phosphate pyrophosphorylase
LIPDLLLVTPDREPDVLIEVVELVLRDVPRGRLGVQLRQRDLGGRALLPLAERLRELTAEAGAVLLVNGRIDVAMAVGADGVHLPERGVDPKDARSLLAAGALVGASKHTVAGVRAAADAGVDYVTFGPLGSVPGKGPAVTGDDLEEAIRVGVPLLALGGVEAGVVAPLLAVGAHGIAVMRSVFDAEDPHAVVQSLFRELDKPRV